MRYNAAVIMAAVLVVFVTVCMIASNKEEKKLHMFRIITQTSKESALVDAAENDTRKQEHIAQKIILLPRRANSADRPFDLWSRSIWNDIEWKDDHGNHIDAGRGGRISKIDGIFWWVGTKPWTCENSDHGDIYLYKSYTVGSNSWQFVRKLVDSPTQYTGGNCQLSKHPTLGTFHLHCKEGEFYISETIEGDFRKLPKPEIFSSNKDSKWGANCMYKERRSSEMYLVTAACDISSGKCTGIRQVYILKMNEAWTGLDETNPIVVTWSWPTREGFCLFRHGQFYYLSASQTAGWRDSDTWVRKAKTLQGLSEAADTMVPFHRENYSGMIRSGGSQHRQILKVGYGKWIFLGSRHPDEEPSEYDSKYGRYIFLPVIFKNGLPNVYWKSQFNLEAYNFTAGDYDKHWHGGYGHKSQVGCPTYWRTCLKTAGCEWNKTSRKCQEKTIG